MDPHPRPKRSVDGFLSPAAKPPQPRPAQHRPPVRPRTAPPARHAPVVKPQPAPQPRDTFRAKLGRFVRALLQAVLFLFLFGLGFFVQTLVIGQVAIAVYAVAAFVLKIPSRTTFLLAVLAFIIVLIAQARHQSQLASVFAIYAFLLLAVGAVTLALELRDDI